jgi:hypothetical protein
VLIGVETTVVEKAVVRLVFYQSGLSCFHLRSVPSRRNIGTIKTIVIMYKWYDLHQRHRRCRGQEPGTRNQVSQHHRQSASKRWYSRHTAVLEELGV